MFSSNPAEDASAVRPSDLRRSRNETDSPHPGSDVGRLFLGIRLECAECHNDKKSGALDQVKKD